MAEQCGPLGRGARPAEPHVAGLDKLLFLRDAHAGLSRRGQLCLRASARILAEAAQSTIARYAPVFRRGCIWREGRFASAPGATGAAICDSDEVKSAGEPDAGNPHVRFDVAGTGNGVKAETEALAQAKAASNGYSLRLKPPRPSSTLPWESERRHGDSTPRFLFPHRPEGRCGNRNRGA